MLPQEVIRHKRDGQKLTKEELDFFMKGVTDWSVSESQIAAFAMAVYLRGMTNDETAAMTVAMTDSGERLNWAVQNLDGPVLDKNSTGGVGDKVSLVLAPILAACGGYVPMISGRGLGHTGGTLDKLESIPGYVIKPDLETIYKTTREVGCVIIGQTGDLAPADKRMYAVRDVTGTIDSRPLIAGSILSKKFAAGANALVIDLKCGNGAFMRTRDDARTLAQTIVGAANEAGVPTHALISDMNQVMGETVGNALEVNEAIAYLKGKRRNKRLHALVMALCAEALCLKGLAANDADAKAKAQDALDSGRAAEKFAKMVAALGGPADFIDAPEKHLAKAAIIRPVLSDRAGFVRAMDTRKIGLAVLELGGQRKAAGQRIDYAVGFSDFIQTGDKIGVGQPLATVHAQNEDSFAEAEKMLRSAVQTGDEKPEETPVVYETVTA